MFFTVSGSSFAFDECSIEILDDLPLKAIDIRTDQLSVELNIQDYGSASHSTIRIDEVSAIQDEYLPDQAVIVLQGETDPAAAGHTTALTTSSTTAMSSWWTMAS